MIAAGGRDAFYRGPIAERDRRLLGPGRRLLLARRTSPSHPSEWVEPISTTYRGVTVWELPPNGQGLAALQMLNILEGFDLAAMGRDSADLWHLMVEAKKLAYDDRARFYADPAFAELPVAGLISQGLRASRRGALIDLARAARRLEPGNPHLRARRHHLPGRRRLRRHDGLPDPVQLHRLRLRLRGPRARLRDPEPRRAVLPRPRPPERPRAGQASVPHHHPGLPRRARRAQRRLRRHGRATCSPRGTCRSWSTWSTSA